MAEPAYEGWAIVELMGHRRLAGFVAEVTFAGASMLRLDVYRGDDQEPGATQFYSSGALYCLTPCTEQTAREVAGLASVAPVHRWELPRGEGVLDQ